MALGKRFRHCNHMVIARLGSPMIAFLGVGPTMLARRLVDKVVEDLLDVRRQARLILFDRQDIVTALIHDLTGDGLLATHGIDGD